mmetsp:Transcript_61532/g.178419  ORF Transcript_61532/g.178419 Transcript_61532/m.178419 type:complete len:219 (-) Transcript_61532:197-853(-)
MAMTVHCFDSHRSVEALLAASSEKAAFTCAASSKDDFRKKKASTPSVSGPFNCERSEPSRLSELCTSNMTKRWISFSVKIAKATPDKKIVTASNFAAVELPKDSNGSSKAPSQRSLAGLERHNKAKCLGKFPRQHRRATQGPLRRGSAQPVGKELAAISPTGTAFDAYRDSTVERTPWAALSSLPSSTSGLKSAATPPRASGKASGLESCIAVPAMPM